MKTFYIPETTISDEQLLFPGITYINLTGMRKRKEKKQKSKNNGQIAILYAGESYTDLL